MTNELRERLQRENTSFVKALIAQAQAAVCHRELMSALERPDYPGRSLRLGHMQERRAFWSKQARSYRGIEE